MIYEKYDNDNYDILDKERINKDNAQKQLQAFEISETQKKLDIF